jgi:hypothetical protein
MDIRLWTLLESLEEKDLDAVQKYLDRRRNKSRSSRVVESVPHGDGWLHLETRINPKTGTERGPYWYFKVVREGRQKTQYIGKVSLVEARRRVDG